MKTKLLLLLALGVAMVAVPTAAFGNPAHAGSNSATFPDSIGEDPAAPDITSVAVSNTDAGLITFKINISNRPALTPDMTVLLFLDTDQKPTTGDPQSVGADYAIELDPGQAGLFKWNGSDFVTAPSQSSLTFGYDPTGATLRVGAADLGGTKGINFGTFAVSGITTDPNGDPNFSNAHEDAAPDAGHGFFSYSVVTKLTLGVVAYRTAPKPAKAGKNFVAALAATESDTGGPVKSGKVRCSATIGTSHIAAAGHAVANGIAVCSWHVPRNARGKTIRGSIKLTVQGVTVKRTFAVRIT